MVTATVMASQQSPYQYKTLPETSVRLLEILRESTADSIRCRLHAFEAKNCPAYFAVSYTWEPRNPQRAIVLDGANFTIGRNLACFIETILLLTKNNSESTVFYWIDQICIDQTNIPERNIQVALMRQIYSNAVMVMIWLGEAADDSGFAIELMHGKRGSLMSSGGLRAKLAKPLVSKRAAKALRALADRSYWNRVWILQEVMLARAAVVLCGLSAVAWGTFQAFYMNGGMIDYSPLKSLIAIDSLYKVGERDTLVRQLLLLKDQQCSDPRDTVYGLLGIVEPNSNGLSLRPDYSYSIREVYESVLRYIDEPSLTCLQRGAVVIRLTEAFGMGLETIQEPFTLSFLECFDLQCGGIGSWHRLWMVKSRL